MGLYRQGDVLLERRYDQAEGTMERIVVQEGESTGHAHVLEGEVREGIIWIAATTLLEHEEHDPITFPPGGYERHPQVEYTPAEIVRVAD